VPQEITEVAKPTRRRVDGTTFSIQAILIASLFWVMPREINLQLAIRLSKILINSRREQEQGNKLEMLLNFRIFSTAKKDNYIPVDSLCRSGFVSNLVLGLFVRLNSLTGIACIPTLGCCHWDHSFGFGTLFIN